jgi:hypothetical protein
LQALRGNPCARNGLGVAAADTAEAGRAGVLRVDAIEQKLDLGNA